MAERAYSHNVIKRLRALGRKRARSRHEVGAPPGTIVEAPDAHETTVHGWSLGQGEAREVEISAIAQIDRLVDEPASGQAVWIDVRGLANMSLIKAICERFGLHPLVIEDVVNVTQRPGAEVHGDDYIVIVLREPCGGPPFDSEQIAIVIGPHFVLTLQERPGDIFDPVRKRLAEGYRQVREIGAPFLGYALLDAVVDSYFPILDGYGELTETLEQAVIDQPDPTRIADIHLLKRELLEMRRALWAQREAIATVLRGDSALVPDALRIYYRDCSDHSFQLLDMVEVYREISLGLVDLHLSSVSNRMNEIMKVLTVIATIFIPMTFLSGLYGMNFDTSSPYNLPELKWKFGYYYALGLMATSAGIMLLYFWRKGWIRRSLNTGSDQAR